VTYLFCVINPCAETLEASSFPKRIAKAGQTKYRKMRHKLHLIKVKGDERGVQREPNVRRNGQLHLVYH
jgi:hypothetical protein